MSGISLAIHWLIFEKIGTKRRLFVLFRSSSVLARKKSFLIKLKNNKEKPHPVVTKIGPKKPKLELFEPEKWNISTDKKTNHGNDEP